MNYRILNSIRMSETVREGFEVQEGRGKVCRNAVEEGGGDECEGGMRTMSYTYILYKEIEWRITIG
jgi:hypothetical protein